ncbi:MAG: 3-phosphoshikimate 1-carboxyvinyltransferase [Rhodospirillales bacterium]
MQPLISQPAGPLSGRCSVPGDKSISHRALMLGACGVGESVIEGLLEGEDVLATADALRSLGADIVRDDGVWRVRGRGVGALAEPATVLDLGNSGTGARLLMGLVASHPFTSVFTGDASLRERPMLRVMQPLERMGAQFWSRNGGRLPITVRGCADLLPIGYRLPVASAQVKSAILLAGLNTAGETSVIEPLASRDHTERLLRYFGADIEVENLADGGRRITLRGQPELSGRAVTVPADVSSAAFPLAAACMIPGSSLRIDGVGINPLRTGLIDTLKEMGAEIGTVEEREVAGEPVADLLIEMRPLKGIKVPKHRVPSMIDEFPVLAAAAACADGVTRMQGLAELRVKESNRLTAIAEGLSACGVEVASGQDWIEVTGCGGPPPGGGSVVARFDHRIAMAFLALGAACKAPVIVDDVSAIATSFPGFIPLMNRLGTRIKPIGN